MPTPVLSLVIPSRTTDAADLQRLLASLSRQTLHDVEILVEVRGNSEEAKARALLRARGEIVGFLCTDNDCIDPRFLQTMVWYARQPGVTGAYTARYAYVRSDPALNRYFALLGANDPLCWWLGKADRQSYLEPVPHTQQVSFLEGPLPSLGDNGFFLKRQVLQQVPITPETFGSCMCLCTDLQQQGQATYWQVAEQALWHRTGSSWWDYFRRRARYVDTLAFQHASRRRWRMVESPIDWWRTLAFALASVLLVPQLWVALRGYRRLKDPAWFCHLPVCLACTCLYTWLWLRHGCRSSFQALIGQRS